MNFQQKLTGPKPPSPVQSPHVSARPAKRHSILKRHARVVGAFFAVLLMGGGYAWYSLDSSDGPQPLIVTAERGDVEDLVTALGTLQPFFSVDIGAQVTGKLEKIYVNPGDVVQQGQLLAEIDAAVAAAKVDADRALLANYQSQLAEKQSNLTLAKIQADRQTRLLAENATSQDAYDNAQAGLRAAEAQLKVVSAQINQAQSTLRADSAIFSYTKILAPSAGTIANIVAREGQTLNANQTTPLIMTLADLKTMTVNTQVSEADIPKLKLGMEAFFTTLGNPNKRYAGKLRQILPTPTVVNNVVLYTALFDVQNDGQLMSQMSAQVFFVSAAARDVVTVPMAALQFGGPPGGTGGGRRAQQSAEEGNTSEGRPASITIAKDDGSFDTRDVVVGVSDRVTAAILSGLEEGERVVAGNPPAGRGRGRGANGRGFLGGLR